MTTSATSNSKITARMAHQALLPLKSQKQLGDLPALLGKEEVSVFLNNQK